MSRASKSCRHSGAVGSGPTKVTQFVVENFTPKIGKILDLGSGKVPRQTELLRQEGFDVGAYDLPENNEIGVHITPRDLYIDTRWDVILLSNVLNVQKSIVVATDLVEWARRKGARIIIFNLPNDPVYWKGDMKPRERQVKLTQRLATLGVPLAHIDQHDYCGGTVFVIDNEEPKREQPQIRGCLFNSY